MKKLVFLWIITASIIACNSKTEPDDKVTPEMINQTDYSQSGDFFKSKLITKHPVDLLRNAGDSEYHITIGSISIGGGYQMDASFKESMLEEYPTNRIIILLKNEVKLEEYKCAFQILGPDMEYGDSDYIIWIKASESDLIYTLLEERNFEL